MKTVCKFSYLLFHPQKHLEDLSLHDSLPFHELHLLYFLISASLQIFFNEFSSFLFTFFFFSLLGWSSFLCCRLHSRCFYFPLYLLHHIFLWYLEINIINLKCVHCLAKIFFVKIDAEREWCFQVMRKCWEFVIYYEIKNKT